MEKTQATQNTVFYWDYDDRLQNTVFYWDYDDRFKSSTSTL